MKSVFKVTGLLVILFSNILFGQDANQFYQSVLNLQYKKEDILPYLWSSDIGKAKKALYAIANSGDSAYLPQVLKYNNPLLIVEKIFALSKLPITDESAEYLIKTVKEAKSSDIIRKSLIAIAKSGTDKHADAIVNLYNSRRNTGIPGISLATYHFKSRKIQSKNLDAILLNEIASAVSSDRLKEALFALYRLPLDSSYYSSISTLLQKKQITELSGGASQYLLGTARKYKIPISPLLLSKFQKSTEFAVRVEAVRLWAQQQFNDTISISAYLKFFEDDNLNIHIQAAQSITSSTIIESNVRLWLIDHLFAIYEQSSNSMIKMQLLAAIARLHTAFSEVIEKKLTELQPEHELELLLELTKNKPEKLIAIIDSYERRPLKEKHIILSNWTELRKRLSADKYSTFRTQLILHENSPLLLAAMFENFEAVELQQLTEPEMAQIKQIVQYNRDNNDYADVLSALLSLVEKDSTTNGMTLRNSILNSNIASIASKSGRKPTKESILTRLSSHLGSAAKVQIETEYGNIVVKLYPEIAPISSANFLYLISREFYTNIRYHRVVPGFVIQAGDPSATGSGGPGYEIVTELSDIHYSKRILGMARSGFHTEGSQWFITTGEYYHLDGNYTVFGEVLSGMDIAEKMIQGDLIRSISIVK